MNSSTISHFIPFDLWNSESSLTFIIFSSFSSHPGEWSCIWLKSYLTDQAHKESSDIFHEQRAELSNRARELISLQFLLWFVEFVEFFSYSSPLISCTLLAMCLSIACGSEVKSLRSFELGVSCGWSWRGATISSKWLYRSTVSWSKEQGRSTKLNKLQFSSLPHLSVTVC